MTDNRNTTSPRTSPVDPRAEIVLTKKQLAERHQRSLKTLRNDRVKGCYIPFVKIGCHIRYGFSDVLAYERARAMTSTSSIEDAGAKNNHA